MSSESRGWFAELLARRVPQIMGIYIGACWMTVEIGDWLSEQLGLAPNLIAYLFVLMIALLPSVALLAWNHGAPGKDRSTRFEKLFVPANLTAAIVAVVAFLGYAPPGAPGSAIAPAESALVERTVVDETGTEQTFTVARAGFHRLVFASFWQAETDELEDDWRRYAVSWLIGVALGRDPLISLTTPYNSGIISEYIEAGYPDGLDEPRALAVRQAQRLGARYLVRGGMSLTDGGLRLTATVIEAESGAVTGEMEAQGANVIEATSELVTLLRPLLAPDISDQAAGFTSIPLAEATTPSNEALEAFVAGLNARYLDRDQQSARAHLEQALVVDPAFALAAAQLHYLLRLTGDLGAAVEMADRALVHEYKLDNTTRFSLKANRHALTGDYDTAMRVLRMWTEVHPSNFVAWMSLAQNQVVIGEFDAAIESLRRAEALDPDNDAILKRRAAIDQLTGDYEAAAERLSDLIEREPDDVGARIDLGQSLARAGRSEAALEVFQEAELLADDPLRVRLSQANVWIREGEFDKADRTLDALLAASSDPARRAQIVTMRLPLLAAAGRYRALLATLDEHQELMQQVMAPAQYWSMWAEFQWTAHSGVGDFDAAAAAIEVAQDALGEPFNRILALNWIRHLVETGGSPSDLEPHLEQLRFFETSFSYGAIIGVVRWGEALARGHAGATGEAVELMREARDRYRASGLGLNMSAIEGLEHELARLMIADGQRRAAGELVDHILERHPSMAEARWTRIELALEEDDEASARADLVALLAQWENADEDLVRLNEAEALLDRLGAPAD